MNLWTKISPWSKVSSCIFCYICNTLRHYLHCTSCTAVFCFIGVFTPKTCPHRKGKGSGVPWWVTVLIKKSGLTHDLKQMSSMLRRGPRSRTKTRVYDRKPLEHISSGLVFSKFKRKSWVFCWWRAQMLWVNECLKWLDEWTM